MISFGPICPILTFWCVHSRKLPAGVAVLLPIRCVICGAARVPAHTNAVCRRTCTARSSPTSLCPPQALIVAAICHDLEHPGLTNGFQVSTESSLARRYNDIKVLENHHASTAFDVFDESALFQAFSPSDRKASARAREMVFCGAVLLLRAAPRSGRSSKADALPLSRVALRSL